MERIKIALRAVKIRNITIKRWEEYIHLLAYGNNKTGNSNGCGKKTKHKR